MTENSLKHGVAERIGTMSLKNVIEVWDNANTELAYLKIVKQACQERFSMSLGDHEHLGVGGRKLTRVTQYIKEYDISGLRMAIEDADMLMDVLKPDNRAIDALLKEDALTPTQKEAIRSCIQSKAKKPFIKIT